MSLLHDPAALADVHAVDPAVLGQIPYICWAVGIQHITEANASDFYVRVSFYEKVNGTFLNMLNEDESDWEPHPITPEHVRSLIGYRTNTPTMTEVQFRNHVYKNYKSDATREF